MFCVNLPPPLLLLFSSSFSSSSSSSSSAYYPSTSEQSVVVAAGRAVVVQNWFPSERVPWLCRWVLGPLLPGKARHACPFLVSNDKKNDNKRFATARAQRGRRLCIDRCILRATFVLDCSSVDASCLSFMDRGLRAVSAATYLPTYLPTYRTYTSNTPVLIDCTRRYITFISP